MHVAILGLGPSLSEYCNTVKRVGGQSAYCDEVWGINAAGDVYRCHRVFHMDDVRIQEKRAALKPDGGIANMLKWMKSYPGPIYTSRPHPDYPGLVAYPLEDVLNDIGYGYLNNTTAYAVAYAIHLKATRISLFGADFTYAHAHQAERGRGSVEFMLGIAAQRGIRIVVPQESSLLDACEPEKFYGYDTLNVGLSTEGDRVRVTLTPREDADIPTGEEIEARYDHNRHPNSLVS